MSAPSSPLPLRQSFSQLRGHVKQSASSEGLDSASQHHSSSLNIASPDDVPYPETVGDQSIIAPPELRPYFTLVEDTVTGEHTHPVVHYVFSDDDPDIVTSSVLDATDATTPSQRVVIVDVSADARTIVSAHSLSPTWQVHQAAISQAPSWNESGPTQTTEGLMLRIQGCEAGDGPAESDHGQMDAIDVMRATIGTFEQGLGSLEGMLQTDVVADAGKHVQSPPAAMS